MIELILVVLVLILVCKKWKKWNDTHWVSKSFVINPRTGLLEVQGGGYWIKRGKVYEYNPDGNEGLI